MIPPHQNSDFVAAMEQVLLVYKRLYNPLNPVVCMDESPKQLIAQISPTTPVRPGYPSREDYEYRRCGVCNIFMASEPLSGKRFVKVTEYKKKPDWALFIKEISDSYKDAEKITLVMDNYCTHKAGSLYEAFNPEEAAKILNRFEFIYTPKHGSWLNMAEIELNVLSSQCLKRRIDNIDTIRNEVKAWQNYRNTRNYKVNWQFTEEEARIKLKRLYPTLEH